MAPQRSSRSKKKRQRSTAVKRSDLRSPKVIDGKDRATRRKERELRREREAGKNISLPKLAMRGAGRRGALNMSIGGAMLTAAVLLIALLIGRWNTVQFPDSLWLYLGTGMMVASVGVGWVARSARDVRAWTIATGVAVLAALEAEFLFGPSCPSHDVCAAVGARGWLGPFGTVLTFAAIVGMTLLVGTQMLRIAVGRRPANGRISTSITLRSMVMPTLLVGLPLFGIVLVADIMLRPQPQFAQIARSQAIEDADCFGITATLPALYTRVNPDAEASTWTSYLVGRVHEQRTLGSDGKPLPSPRDINASATPYEALVSIDNNTGKTADVVCRRLSPAAGNATKADGTPLPADTIKSENPINPAPPGASSPDLLQRPSSTPATPAKASGKRTTKGNAAKAAAAK